MVDHFPVEHGLDAVLVDDEVPVAEVAVDDGDRSRVGALGGEAAETQFDCGMRIAEKLNQLVERLPGALQRVPLFPAGHLGRRDGMNAGEDLAALAGQRGPHRGVAVVAQDAAGDGLAVDVFHEDERRSQDGGVVGVEEQAGLGDAGAGRSDEGGRLVRHSFRPDHGGRVAADDELVRRAVGQDTLQRPRFAAGAARELMQVLDLRARVVEDLAHHRGDARVEVGRLCHYAPIRERP